MEVEEAKQFLIEMGQLSVDKQRMHLSKINKSFKIFWGSYPSEDEFYEVTEGVLITSRIIYYMIRHNW